MSGKMTYRQYLRYHANNHGSATKRKEAQALLNVVGNNGGLNGYFLTGNGINRKGQVQAEQTSNGFTASALNRQVNPWWLDSYTKYSNQYDKDEKNGLHSGPWKGGRGYDPYAAQQARDNARKKAFIDDKLSRMPVQLDLINQAEQNRYAHIEDDYNRANSDLEDSWKQTQEDHNTATRQRLASRRRQIGVADDDFKKQNDAYSRYFARSGAGSSSTAQYTVPTLLARATQKIRNDIEDNNAENARAQETSFNRASLDYKKGFNYIC